MILGGRVTLELLVSRLGPLTGARHGIPAVSLSR